MALPLVVLKPLYHRGGERIFVHFAYNGDLQSRVRQLKDAKWSRTHTAWYLPLSKEHYTLLGTALACRATINADELKKYLIQRKAVAGVSNPKISRQQTRIMMERPLSPENINAYTAFKNLILLKGYSGNTLRTYSQAFLQLLRVLGVVAVGRLTSAHIQSYLLWLLQEKGCSETHVHTVVNALKFYFEGVEKRPKEFYDLPRPKKPQKLPAILAESEVETLLKSIKNLKHRALLMTAYSAGLRVSELVNLKVGDIDGKRMMIHIRCGKGKKDRMVSLSPVLMPVLRSYYKAYKPKAYLFEGEQGGPYSTRSAQLVLRAAKKAAHIRKSGSIHGLRHAYATHLLEAGIDVRYIQDLLGHNSLTTTMLYTHVARKDAKVVQSPLNKLKIG